MDWLRTTFVPSVNERRERFGDMEQRAYLLMDNCSSHRSNDVTELCEDSNIELVYFFPTRHTSSSPSTSRCSRLSRRRSGHMSQKKRAGSRRTTTSRSSSPGTRRTRLQRSAGPSRWRALSTGPSIHETMSPSREKPCGTSKIVQPRSEPKVRRVVVSLFNN